MPTVSTVALDVIARDLQLGLPYPLDVPSRGATSAERAELRRQAEEELRDAELLDHTGRVVAHLERWLRILARPEVSIDSAYLPALDAAPVRAIVARSGKATVLATQHDASAVRLRPVPRDQLVPVIVDMLPAARRGTEASLSLPVGDPEDGTLVEDRQALARLTALPRRRGGQIAANSASGLGRRRRSAVLSWFDNDVGRYFAQHRDARDGCRWVTIAPADTATLCQRIGEMMTSVTAAGR